MKRLSRCLVISLVILSAAALVSGALARGGGRGGGGRISGGAILCLSGSQLNRSLTTIGAIIEVSGSQKTALEELKQSAKEYSDNMSRACGGDTGMDIPAKLAASDKRLEAALTGVRKLKPAAEKFYATLSDEQKAQASLFIDLPGL
jgi:LTXXQ motif family protein